MARRIRGIPAMMAFGLTVVLVFLHADSPHAVARKMSDSVPVKLDE